MKYDKDKVEATLNQEYFARKVDLVPVSLKETYSDLVSKNPVLVSRELIVDDRPLIGVEYAPDGEIANVYTTDSKGRRVNFENTDEQKQSAAPDLISERLASVKNTMSHETNLAKTVAKTEPEKKTVTPRKLDVNTAKTVRGSQRA